MASQDMIFGKQETIEYARLRRLFDLYRPSRRCGNRGDVGRWRGTRGRHAQRGVAHGSLARHCTGVAEGVGFEPTMGFHPCQFSRLVP